MIAAPAAPLRGRAARLPRTRRPAPGWLPGECLQLTPHLHCLVPESMWTTTGEEVVAVLRRVLTLARRAFEAAAARLAAPGHSLPGRLLPPVNRPGFPGGS